MQLIFNDFLVDSSSFVSFSSTIYRGCRLWGGLFGLSILLKVKILSLELTERQFLSNKANAF
jgi:hypothetical protein